LIQEADGVAPDLHDMVKKADKLLNDAVEFAYGEGSMFDYIPSFARSKTNPKLLGTITQGEEAVGEFSSDRYLLVSLF
jgi:hypothetical protein